VNGTLAFSLAIGRFDDDNGDGVIDHLDTPDVVVSNRSGESLNAGAGSLTVGLNAIAPGALSVELPTDTRTAGGLNFGLRTINVSPEIAAASDPVNDLPPAEADIVLTGASAGIVNGSLITDAAGGSATFIKTGEQLEADTYTVTIRSASDSFVTADGDLLDGDLPTETCWTETCWTETAPAPAEMISRRSSRSLRSARKPSRSAFPTSREDSDRQSTYPPTAWEFR